jgi:hypothetical protein
LLKERACDATDTDVSLRAVAKSFMPPVPLMKCILAVLFEKNPASTILVFSFEVNDGLVVLIHFQYILILSGLLCQICAAII